MSAQSSLSMPALANSTSTAINDTMSVSSSHWNYTRIGFRLLCETNSQSGPTHVGGFHSFDLSLPALIVMVVTLLWCMFSLKVEQHKVRLRGEEIGRRSAEGKWTDNETLPTYSVLVQPWQEKVSNETMQDMGVTREKDTVKSHRSNTTK